MKEFSKLCTPARVYFIIAVIAALVALFNGATLMTEFIKLLFAFAWTFLLGWLCSKGYVSVSWFLVLLPYILILLATLNLYHVTEQQRSMMRAIKLQGAFGQEPFHGFEGFGNNIGRKFAVNKESENAQDANDIANDIMKKIKNKIKTM